MNGSQKEKGQFSAKIDKRLRLLDKPYTQLILGLGKMQDVDAVAFSVAGYRSRNYQNCLIMHVFESWIPGTQEAIEGNKRVNDLRDAFVRTTRHLIEIEIDFVDVNGNDLESAKKQTEKQWPKDPSIPFISFIPFRPSC